MNYVVVDFEMNAIANQYKEERAICNLEIIEIGAVILDEQFLVMGEFKTLVKPQYNDTISKRYESLTGISIQMLYDSPTFTTAYEMFVNWCEMYGKDYEVYAWSDSDYNQLVAEMKLKNYENMSQLERWYDFQKEYTQTLGLERALSLENALYYAGVNPVGRMHDALYDAKNTAELFAIVRDSARCEEVLKGVIDVLKPTEIKSSLGDMFDFSALLK